MSQQIITPELCDWITEQSRAGHPSEAILGAMVGSGWDATVAREEIFGPVLQIVRADSFEEAVSLPSEHQYGNGVAIFTRNGRAAREFAAQVNVGMVGINVPIPVPVAYHTFGGWKRSAFGDTNQHGIEGVKFYTKVKTVTARWPEGEAGDSSFVIPTMK